MYERFTDRARKVMQLANQEAQRFNHEAIEPEHILIGLAKEGSGVAANVLKNLDIDLRKIRLEVERTMTPGSDEAKIVMGRIPLSERALKVPTYAIEAASDRGDNYVGTEHVFLGVLRQQEEAGGDSVLMRMGVTAEKFRLEVHQLLTDSREDALVRMTRERDDLLARLVAIQRIIVLGVAGETPTVAKWAGIISQPVTITEPK